MIVVGNILTEGGKNAPQINQLETFTDFGEALDYAVQLVMEQQDNESERDVRKELNDDGDYADVNGMFSVFISDQTPADTGDASRDFELTFGVNGSVTQVIRPEGSIELTPDHFKRGDVLTTLGHGGEILALPNLNRVGRVVSQEVGDDTEYDFNYDEETDGFE